MPKWEILTMPHSCIIVHIDYFKPLPKCIKVHCRDAKD